MVGRLLSALWKIALALMVLNWMADIARDGHAVFALAMVMFPIGIVMLIRARAPARSIVSVTAVRAEHLPDVCRALSRPDQVRIASLAASGNAIGAIRALRKLVDIDLRTAKDAVDQLAAPIKDEASKG